MGDKSEWDNAPPDFSRSTMALTTMGRATWSFRILSWGVTGADEEADAADRAAAEDALELGA